MNSASFSPLGREHSRWYQAWVLLRSGVLLGAIYLAGTLLQAGHLTLWFYLTLEATNRYLPAWLQLVIVLFLGWQLDVLYSWPLGTGVALVAATLLWLWRGQMWQQAPSFLMWRLLGWLLFHFVLEIILGSSTISWAWWVQTVLYLGVAGVLWRRAR